MLVDGTTLFVGTLLKMLCIHLHPGILFGIIPERRSESSRNRVHLAPDSPVNGETGMITAKHIFVAIDAGRLVESQIGGQLAQTVSRFLKEELKFGPQAGNNGGSIRCNSERVF